MASSTTAAAMRVVVRDLPGQAGADAAGEAAQIIRQVVRERGSARVLFASAPSQLPMLEALKEQDLPWSQVVALHLDEYVGIDPAAPQAFGQWLRDHLFDEVQPGVVELIRPDADAEEECRRYAAEVRAAPIDLVCLGIGVNGHIAFNEPYQWTIDDPVVARVVDLDTVSRQQQVDDGCFAGLAEVPTRAITLTVPAILSARHLVVMVPGAHKADAVAACVDGEVTPSVPASALRTHPSVALYLDSAAARLTSRSGGTPT